MIDARGLSCPMPVVMTQKAIQKDAPAALEVLVDAQVAVENITRYRRHQKAQTSQKKRHCSHIINQLNDQRGHRIPVQQKNHDHKYNKKRMNHK